MIEIDFIGASTSLGSRKLGTEIAPIIIHDYCFNRAVFKHKWNDCGFVSSELVGEVDEGDSYMPYLSQIIDFNIKLRNKVISSLNRGHFPFVVGGDHSIAWGTISAVMSFYDNPHCLYADAHTDINPASESVSHNIHGMHMAYICGFDNIPGMEALQDGRRLKSSQLTYFGCRSIDPPEQSICRRNDIKIIQDVKSLAGSASPTYLSWDIDVFDPKEIPATGVPVRGGLTYNQGLSVLDLFFRNYDITGMELVEFNPLLDENRKTYHKICGLISYVDNLLN